MWETKGEPIPGGHGRVKDVPGKYILELLFLDLDHIISHETRSRSKGFSETLLDCLIARTFALKECLLGYLYSACWGVSG